MKHINRILDFEINIDETIYDNDLLNDLRIDRTELNEEFIIQSEKYAYYAILAERAKAKYNLIKFELDHLYARLDFEKRQKAAEIREIEPKFRYTEKMCESEIITDSRFVKKKKELLKAQELSGLLSKAAEAINGRKDMLVQLGVNIRMNQSSERLMETDKQTVKTVIRKK